MYSRNEALETDYDRKNFIGNIFETKNYGGIMVIGVHAMVGRNRRYIVEFLNDRHQQLASKSQILYGQIKNNSLLHSKIGKIYDTYKSGKCTILEVYKQKKGKRQIARVKFLDTGHEQNYSVGDIERGSILDPYAKFIYGVGYYGELSFNPKNNKDIYTRWYEMIKRVYKDGGHTNYKEVSVCERWHCLKNFYEDFKELEGYDNLINFPNIKFHIDKDIFGNGKLYSKDNCILIPHDLNNIFVTEVSTNSSGYTGVSYEKNSGKYQVIIVTGGKRKFLGYVSDLVAGYKKYAKAKLRYCDEILSKYNFIEDETKQRIRKSLEERLARRLNT
jgi:ribosomal protein L21E